ncbi:flavin-containing monooxygenase [Pseudomonas zhanjiangensis]|uniref:Flavin-containing monooxygenase n=1 Tax=Pseudomonas zhanjiangensis TaxID=3239015 RepID=A0ABV3YVF4_9PSED
MHKRVPSGALHHVLIIGSGFGGLGLAIRLQQAGIDDFLLLEKAGEVGGTWRDNSYPGAACGVPSHLYSFSFAPKTDWTRKYAPQAEILEYLRECVERYRLRPRIRFGCEVMAAVFDEPAGLWRVSLANGEVLAARLLVSACGQLNRPAIPALPGIERFQGQAFHSARWRHELDLAGQRVAVIGTGASAIQFVPQLQPKVAQLTLFQRSAAYVNAKPDRAYRAWELATLRRWPWLQRLDRALKYLHHEARALAFVSWPWLMKPLQWGFRRHLARSMADPEKRAQLLPDYPMGCKRILISNDYYPALAQANVRIVDEAIAEVRERAIVTVDGQEHPCDLLIYATGFASTEFLAPMRIVGRNGLELARAWREGAEAYKGISVSGFPNLFILYGPNTNLGHNSIIYMLESQFDYVLGCIEAMQRQGLRYLDVKPEVQRGYNQRIQAGIQHTVWNQGCSSWYKTSSGKHTNNWPGYTFTYRRLTRAPELSDYECTR